MADTKQEQFRILMEAATEHLQEGRLEEAERSFREALAVKDDHRGHLGLGRVLMEKGDLSGAEQSFLEAIRINPRHLRAFIYLGTLLARLDRPLYAFEVFAQAANVAKQLKESETTQAGILFYMGEIKLRLKQLQEALGLFEEAVKKSPRDAYLQTRIGDTLMQEGYPAESEGFYQAALDIDPEPAHVYNRLGIAFRRQGKYDQAWALYDRARVFHPEDENLLYNMGRCLWENGQSPEAVKALDQALELNPDFKEAKELRDAVLAGLKPPSRRPQALEHREAGDLVRLDSDEPEEKASDS